VSENPPKHRQIAPTLQAFRHNTQFAIFSYDENVDKNQFLHISKCAKTHAPTALSNFKKFTASKAWEGGRKGEGREERKDSGGHPPTSLD